MELFWDSINVSKTDSLHVTVFLERGWVETRRQKRSYKGHIIPYLFSYESVFPSLG